MIGDMIRYREAMALPNELGAHAPRGQAPISTAFLLAAMMLAAALGLALCGLAR